MPAPNAAPASAAPSQPRLLCGLSVGSGTSPGVLTIRPKAPYHKAVLTFFQPNPAIIKPPKAKKGKANKATGESAPTTTAVLIPIAPPIVGTAAPRTIAGYLLAKPRSAMGTAATCAVGIAAASPETDASRCVEEESP